LHKSEVLKALQIADPYPGFEPNQHSILTGWNLDLPFLRQALDPYRPQLMIEVGTWLGLSAIASTSFYMDVCKYSDFSLICVDTWLGSIELWRDPEYRNMLSLKHGYPSIYYDFLSNVVRSRCQDHIVPLPVPSLMGAQMIAEAGLQADIIYIDASHEEPDVAADLKAYWPLVKPGGMLYGDDWDWEGVEIAVRAFAVQHHLQIHYTEQKWIIYKPI
jgi:hypothetical protein